MIIMWMRRGYLAVAWLFVVGVVIQVFLAGLGLFDTPSYWPTHVEFGYAIGWLLGIMFVLALVGRIPRSAWGRFGLLFLVYVVQTVLPLFQSAAPFVAALHPANALIVFGVAVVVARGAPSLIAEPARRVRPTPVAVTGSAEE